MTAIIQAPEFSRLVDVADLSDGGIEFDIEASAEERQALARRFELQGIETLTAHIGLFRIGGSAAMPMVRVKARFQADVVQTCVVTLEPVAAHVEDAAVVDFTPPVGPEPRQISILVDEVDPPEPLLGNQIDVGEVVAEHLALALDPYPRKPGAAFEPAGETDNRAGRDVGGPFAALRSLKPGK